MAGGSRPHVSRRRIACPSDGSVGSSGICAILESSRRYELRHDLDGLSELAVITLDPARDGRLQPVAQVASSMPVVAVGPVELVADALAAGARGYASTAATTDELMDVVEAALAGRRGLTPDATDFLIGQATGRPLEAEELTARQLDILHRLVAGEGIASIAVAIGISRQAVGQALERLRRRARVATNRDLVRFVRDHALLEGPR